MTPSDYKQKLEQLKGQKRQLLRSIEATKTAIRAGKQRSLDVEEAQRIIQYVARQTQEQLQFRISELVSMALAAVFEDPYAFKLEFCIRYGKTEARIYFERDGKRYYDPIFAAGMGACDVAAFGMRVSLWSLTRPKTDNFMLLDEPFRDLKGMDESEKEKPREQRESYACKAGKLVSMISKKLNLQFLIASHSPDVIEAADRVFEVTLVNGVSQVERVRN